MQKRPELCGIRLVTLWYRALPLFAEPLRLLPPGQRPEEACHRVLRNCNQHGDCIKRRDWCLLRGSIPASITLRGRREERRPAYLFGRSEGNPTHVTCLHMLPLLRWMELADMPLGQVGHHALDSLLSICSWLCNTLHSPIHSVYCLC